MKVLFKNKVLLYAIVFSAAWHLFWLSAFKVVVVPKPGKAVKFSNVSFLGPILERGAFNVNVGAHQHAALEEKYLDSLTPPVVPADKSAASDNFTLPPFYAPSIENDEDFTSLVISKIDTDKLEPGREVD